MLTDLRHHSKAPLALDALEQRGQEAGLKPSGLWVSVGSEWQDWCSSEDWGLDGTELLYRVALNPTAKILTIESVEQLDSFTASYPAQEAWAQGMGMIDWPRVATEFDGIIISPYQWSRRLGGIATLWYYGWDCASGCIWNPAAVESLTLITER